jgi:hypothetical protein
MTYRELIPFLNDNHFYPDVKKELTLNGENITGLTIYTPSILKDDKLKKIKEVLKDLKGVSVKVSKSDEIEITIRERKDVA